MSIKIILTIITLITLIAITSCSVFNVDISKASSDPEGSRSSSGVAVDETNVVTNQEGQSESGSSPTNVEPVIYAGGTEQLLKIGDVLQVNLNSNPSTGYGWFAMSSDPAVIDQLGAPQYKEAAPDSVDSVLGAGGVESLQFQATTAGSATLTLEYKRGWETDVASDRVMTITVVVK